MDTPNYNQSTIAGESWQRAKSVHIDNPFNGLPSINFVEEKVFVLADKTINEPLGSLATTFDAANPQHGQLYYLLNELYTVLREVRDNPPPVETLPVAD